MVDERKTLWCGNLSDKVTEEILYELFLQVAPLERVRIPTDREGRKSNYAFITLKHEISIDYVVQLLDGTYLFDKKINIKPRVSNPNNAMAHAGGQISPNIEHQSLMNNFNDLFLMGQMMQLTYTNCLQQTYSHQQHVVNNDKFGRERDDGKYYKHNNHHNSNRQGRNNHQRNNHRNYNDRTRRQRYY